MKTAFILIIALVLAFWPEISFADPFLVCDPTSEDIASYIVKVNGGEEMLSQPASMGDGTVRLEYDLAGLPEGPFTIEVAAENVWGRSPFAPFSSTKALPQGPNNLRVLSKP